MRHLYLNETLDKAIGVERLHHQLLPMSVDFELGFDQTILDGLQGKQHTLSQAPVNSGFTSLTAIGRSGKQFIPVFDPRRQGSISVF